MQCTALPVCCSQQLLLTCAVHSSWTEVLESGKVWKNTFTWKRCITSRGIWHAESWSIGFLHQSGVDFELQKHIQQNKQKWRDVLTRLLDCVKYLASQNLALRGHDESLRQTDSHNPGNFLALLDPVLNSHMTYVRANPHSTSYLSPSVQNE